MVKIMLKVIVGEKGAGKTKALLDGVHKAVDVDHGSVVFINNGNRHIYDLNYRIRLVDSSDFEILSYEEFYGLICGIISQDFDTSHVFIDSLTKIVAGTDEEMTKFVDKIDKLSIKYNVEVVITISMSATNVPELVKKYCVNV